MIQRINTLNCADGNWLSYKFVGKTHKSEESIPLTFRVFDWSKLGSYDDGASWCCLFSMDIPWSSSWVTDI